MLVDRRADRETAWLAALLAPVSVDEFLSRYWLKQHLFCRGAAGRFADLISWADINAILEHHWRETFRFRLARQGRDLDPASYADLDGFTPRIRARDLTEHLRRGATLSFDAIDEVHEPLTQLARAFEAFFRGGTKINIYAGWRSLHGLDLHRDNQEIFILHLDGRKRWLLYGHSIDRVDRRDLAGTSIPPAGAVLDEILTPGDLLYIPRGCYHLAVPIDEPALHLTLGVKNPRGSDLVNWIVRRIRSHEIAGQDAPLLGGADERRRYSDALRRAVLAACEGDLVEQYVAETGSNVKPRPAFTLPWSATLDGLPAGWAFSIALKGAARVTAGGASDASVDVECGGRTYRFPRGMRWLVERLDGDGATPIGRVIEAVSGQMDEEGVRTLVAMLLAHDLVVVGDA